MSQFRFCVNSFAIGNLGQWKSRFANGNQDPPMEIKIRQWKSRFASSYRELLKCLLQDNKDCCVYLGKDCLCISSSVCSVQNSTCRRMLVWVCCNNDFGIVYQCHTSQSMRASGPTHSNRHSLKIKISTFILISL